MKTVFRFTAACVAAATLLSLTTPAQEAEPQTVTQEYALRGIGARELQPGSRTNAIGDVLAPDRLLRNVERHRPDDGWWLRDSGDEARCWPSVEDSLYSVASLTGCDEDEGFGFKARADGAAITATPESHRRMKWAIDALRDIADARVHLVVYRLAAGFDPASPLLAEGEVAGALKGARMVGTMSGGLGDPLVLQRTTHRSYVADFDFDLATSAATASPVVATLNTGSEFVGGVVSLPDGRLWIQGWHAAMTPRQWRALATTGGTVELPDTQYRFVPVSAEIENGGAVVLDGGEGERFLVQARCDRVVRDHELKCNDGSVVRLFNVVRSLRGHGLSDEWIMTPNSGQVLGDGFLPQVFFDPNEDGPYNDAALWLQEVIEWHSSDLVVIGPYLGLRMSADGLADADSRAQYEQLIARIDKLRARPSSVAVRITAVQVADDAALAPGILTGSPSTVDVAHVKSLATAKLDRILANMPGQANDLLNLRLAVHVCDYETRTATEIAVDDPAIGTLVHGEQLRWVARDAGDGRMRIEVRAGMSVGPEAFEAVELRKGVVIERSRSALAQMHATAELAVGERMATVSPAAGAEGELIVLIVERLK